jgi:hypothetical protein
VKRHHFLYQPHMRAVGTAVLYCRRRRQCAAAAGALPSTVTMNCARWVIFIRIVFK